MINSLLMSALYVVLLAIGWTLIQNGWRKLFYGKNSQKDVLEDRRSCSNCSCSGRCENENKTKILKKI